MRCFGATILVMLTLVGCAVRGELRPGRTQVHSFSVERSRSDVFDAALTLAQQMNLDVAVLEKQSGLIRFENAALSAAQLDQYVEYPYVKPGTTAPIQSFQQWYNRAIQLNEGPVRGRVSVTLLLGEDGPEKSKAVLRTNWVAQSNRESYPCNSLGTFEREFEEALRLRLGLTILK